MSKLWKRAVFCFLPALLFLFSGCGRNAQEETESGQAFEVYYLNREETTLSSETVYLDEELTQDEQISALLTALQTAPEDVSLKASAGTSFQINGYKVDEGQLNIDVDESYRKLPATTEVLVRASLVRTFVQAEGINHILMTVAGESLTDTSGTAVGPMTADTFIDNAGDAINPNEMVTLTLYFANETGDRLVETTRTLEYNSNISVERLVVDCLVNGPDTDQAFPTINPNTKVLGVTVRDGICYVNFDSTFLTGAYDIVPELTVYSIVNSLVEGTEADQVQITINGESDNTYMEAVDLSRPLEEDMDWVAAEDDET